MKQEDSDSLSSLLTAATPFLRIDDLVREDWCRVMKDRKDTRYGPWRYSAKSTVLDQNVWSTAGEVVYFVTDALSRVRLVGQSMSKLKGRWKLVPMSHVESHDKKGTRAVFHTTAWPAIEEQYENGDKPPFIVSAVFRNELERICTNSSGGLNEVLGNSESHLKRLGFHVESWVCSLDHGNPLWNVQKVNIAMA